MVEIIDPRQRDRRLQELLKKYHGAKRQNRVIVFVLYKKEAARVEQVGQHAFGLRPSAADCASHPRRQPSVLQIGAAPVAPGGAAPSCTACALGAHGALTEAAPRDGGRR